MPELSLLQRKAAYDYVIDAWGASLDTFEFKFVMYLLRATIAYGYEEVTLSYAQMQEGVMRRDEEGWFVPPFGMPLITLRRLVEKLEAKGVLGVTRRGRRPSTFRLNKNWSADVPLAVPKRLKGADPEKPTTDLWRGGDGEGIDNLCSLRSPTMLSESKDIAPTEHHTEGVYEGSKQQEIVVAPLRRTTPAKRIGKIAESRSADQTTGPAENLQPVARPMTLKSLEATFAAAWREAHPHATLTRWAGKEQGIVKHAMNRWIDNRNGTFDDYLDWLTRNWLAVRAATLVKWMDNAPLVPVIGLMFNTTLEGKFIDRFIAERTKVKGFEARTREQEIRAVQTTEGMTHDQAVEELGRRKGAAQARAEMTTAEHNAQRMYAEADAKKDAERKAQQAKNRETYEKAQAARKAEEARETEAAKPVLADPVPVRDAATLLTLVAHGNVLDIVTEAERDYHGRRAYDHDDSNEIISLHRNAELERSLANPDDNW